VSDDDLTSSRIQRLAMFLETHFGEVELHMGNDAMHTEEDVSHGELPNGPYMVIRVDGADASINLLSLVRLPTPHSILI
jgi:cleavage and polyadenylation specificity factor subunit 3